MPPWHRQAEVLRGKAKDDAWVMRKLAGDPTAPLWAIGFHAQQAVEKFLKAVLCWRGIAFPFTHDIEEIMEVIASHHIDLPPCPEQLTSLSTFAAMYRYQEIAPPTQPDRDETLSELEQLVTTTQRWAESYLGPAPGSPSTSTP